MAQLTDRVNALATPATFAMSQRSSEMQARGIDIINLSVGEPDFDTPLHIRDAAKQALDEGFTRYAPTNGFTSLREAISDKLRRENGLQYGLDEIIVGNGAKQCVSGAILSLVSKGDEVIIPAPYWVSYPQMVKLAEGTVVTLKCGHEQGFKLLPDQLEAAITPCTRMLVLCSPCNPTGAVYTLDELRAISEVVKRHPRMMVLSDEIYEHINYGGGHQSIAQIEGMKDRTVVINGVSKAYAMTGWRIGFAAASRDIIGGMSKLQGQTTSAASSVSQKAAEAAYRGPQDCVEAMRKEFERRRDLIVSLAQDIEGMELAVPQGAFYIFPKCSAFYGKHFGGSLISNSQQLSMLLLEEAHVATVAGGAFGDDSCIRLSYAASETDIKEAMRRVKSTLQLLV